MSSPLVSFWSPSRFTFSRTWAASPEKMPPTPSPACMRAKRFVFSRVAASSFKSESWANMSLVPGGRDSTGTR